VGVSNWLIPWCKRNSKSTTKPYPSFISKKFARSKQELEKVLEGPSKELADRARMHLKIAEQRMKPSHEQIPALRTSIISVGSP